MPKVFVMMSGGVDSSVACGVLVQTGYEVVGVFMKCWSLESLRQMNLPDSLYGCFWEDDLQDASLVAKKLGVPFEVWDFEKEYRDRVVQYMIREYQSGRTPNPDVMCNGQIKFGIFYETATGKGADFVATGHYARIQNGKICRSLDKNKDQTYFLWQIKANQIPKILFPIGEFKSKTEVRQQAEKLGLATSAKPDSQGLCFVGNTPLRELLMNTLGRKEGDILDIESGKLLGKHPGAFLYTIGQREKLGLSGGPWFVCKIDVEANQVWVTHGQKQTPLYSRELVAKELNWQVSPSSNRFRCTAQTRYRQTAMACEVFLSEGQAQVIFNEPVRAVTSGQSIVFYDNEVLLGGGVIV